jgi:hypothetical protein
MSVYPWLDRLGGHGPAEWRSCVWVPCLAGLRGIALQSEYCAGLCRLWGMASKAEIVQFWGVQPSQRELLQSCAGLGRLAGKAEIVQGWGQWPSQTELLQGCAGLWWGWGTWPGGDGKCLWIPGLKGSSHGDPEVLRGGSLE